jgi:hypothetical protein
LLRLAGRSVSGHLSGSPYPVKRAAELVSRFCERVKMRAARAVCERRQTLASARIPA